MRRLPGFDATATPATTGDSPIHAFDKPGTYRAQVKITSDALPGVQDVDDVEITVIAPQG